MKQEYLETFAKARHTKVASPEFGKAVKEYFTGLRTRLVVKEIRTSDGKIGEVIRVPEFTLVVEDVRD